MNGRRLASMAAAWAIPGCAIVTLALGLSGWLSYGLRFDTALYRSVALFAIAHDLYDLPPGSSDWRFLAGRWTGLFALFGAALFTVGAVLHERVVLALAQMARQEVIVVGSDALAARAFDAARDAGKSALWVGANAVEGHSLSALALPWPADDRIRSLATYAASADHVLLAQEDDAGALALAQAARAVAPDAFLTVLLHDARLAEDAAAMISEHRTRVLAAGVVAARALHLAHPPFLVAQSCGHPRIHALIVGFGQTGQAIARDLIVNCRTTYLGLPRITVIDPGVGALEGLMRVRAPELDHCAQFNFIRGGLGIEGVEPNPMDLGRDIAADGPVTVAYVCRQNDAEGLSAAGMLQSLLRAVDAGDPPIYVRLNDVGTLKRAPNAGAGLNTLIPFGDVGAIVAATEFLSNSPDRAARAFSNTYRSLLPPEKRNDPTNRSAFAWDELDETFRQATRDSVAHIPAKMASAGVDPRYWRGVTGPPLLPRDMALFNTPEELELLAELEHERWNAQRRMDGWRWADLASKDDRRRLHPNLVPYDQLTDETKEYDRAMVREAQEICWGMNRPPKRFLQRRP